MLQKRLVRPTCCSIFIVVLGSTYTVRHDLVSQRSVQFPNRFLWRQCLNSPQKLMSLQLLCTHNMTACRTRFLVYERRDIIPTSLLANHKAHCVAVSHKVQHKVRFFFVFVVIYYYWGISVFNTCTVPGTSRGI